MWRLGYKTSRKKNPTKTFWEYTYVLGGFDKVLERVAELREIGLTKFSIEFKEEM